MSLLTHKWVYCWLLWSTLQLEREKYSLYQEKMAFKAEQEGSDNE
jgi:hypothetical protein